jgi:predicted MFS family arabinose efflux permease
MQSMLHLGYGWSLATVNQLLLLTGLMGFLGAYLMLQLTEWLAPYTILKLVFIISAALALIFAHYNLEQTYHRFWLAILAAAFIYGVFVRLIPLYLFNLNDFSTHNRLINRFVSYMFSYCVFAPLGLVIIDAIHTWHHSFYDTAPEWVLCASALIGLGALVRFHKLTHAQPSFKQTES